MDAKLQLRVQRYGWDAAAAIYEQEWREQLAPAHELFLKMLDLAPGQNVVETAAASGLVTFPMAKAVGPQGHVQATDLAGEMVDRGRAAAAALGVANVTFARMNGEELDFPDAAFDRAACALGLMYMPDPVKALTEMKRVLRPGGLAAAVVWGDRRNCGWAEVFPIVDARVASEVCPMFFGQGPVGVLAGDFRAAGFADVKEERIKSTVSFGSDKSAIAAVIDGGPVAMAAKRFDPAIRQEVDAEFLASIAQYREGQGYRIPGEFVVVSGIA